MTTESTSSGGIQTRDIDEAPLNKLHILAAICTLGGTVLDGYILGLIGTGLSIAEETGDLALTPMSQGLVAASALIGIFVGGLFFGRIADKYGRRVVFRWNLIAFVVLSLVQLMTVSEWDLIAYRILLGLAIGVEYAVGAALLAEFSPKRSRGVLLGALQAFWIVGFVGAYVFGHFYTGDNWRMFLATSAIPAIIVLVLRSKLPESPRWLMSQGRADEARSVIDKHWGTQYSLPQAVQTSEKGAPISDLFTKENWRRSVYAGLFWACQVGPLFAIFTFINPVLEKLGMDASGFGAGLLMNGLQLAGAIAFIWILQLMSRRGFVIWTFTIQLVTLLIVGLWGDAPVFVLTATLGIFMFVISGACNIQFVYPSEIFETRLRSTGVGFAAAMSRLGAALATYLLPVIIDAQGAQVALLVIAVFPLIGLIASIFWAPETKEKALF